MSVKTPRKGVMQRNKFCEPISCVNDWKLDFLSEFVTFLKDWRSLCGGNERLGLSAPTFDALQQTTEGVILLSRYLLSKDHWNFVLPGQFVSDPIEKR